MTHARIETTRAVQRALVAALAAGTLGDCYLLWGRSSDTAFALPALVVPLLTAVAVGWIIAVALRALAPFDRHAAFACSGAGLIVVAIAVLNLVPPVVRDELTHHLAIPALYVRAGRIIEVPFADQSYYPMLIEMFYTPLLGWLPDELPKYLHLLFGVGSAAWLVLYVRRDERGGAAALAGLLVLSTPIVFNLSASAYVDLGLLFYATGALVALLIWAEAPRTSWLITAALLAGFAAATKYNGLLVIVLLGAGAVLLPDAQHGSRQRLGFAATFVAVALVPLAPWLIKNAMETGNPIFPLFNTLLGGRPLPARGGGIDILTQRRVLYGESWLDIALIPLRIFTTGREGEPARFDGVLNPLLLLGLATALGRGATRRQRFLALYTVSSALLVFFLISLRVRYGIAIVAPLVLLTVDSVVRLRRGGGWNATLVAVALGGALLFSVGHFVLLWRTRDPLSYLSGRLDRDAYIARFVPEYDVLRFANRQLPPSARIYLLFLGNRSYYCERDYVYDTYFSGVWLRQEVAASADGSDLATQLRRAGVSHLLAADELLRRYLNDNLGPEELGRWQDFAANRLRLLSAHNGYGLYEIKGQ